MADRGKLKRAWARLRGGELTPERAFWSVAIGILVGVQPTPGLHLPIVLALCLPLRLDAPVSYLAANISIPPIAPFLWIASVQIGSLVLAGHTVPLTPEGARAIVHAPGPMLAALAVGSPLLGVALGLVGGTLAYAVTRLRRAASTTPFDEAVKRASDRFTRAATRRSEKYYVRAKLRSDASTRAVADRAPLGEVIDLGCGRGQLAIVLLELGAAKRVRGYDWDEAKIALAERAGEGLDATFERADVRSAAIDSADTVLLVDVLHYLAADEQDALVARAADHVRAGGRLFIRDASRGYGVRSWLALAAERIGTAAHVNRGERVLLRDVARDFVPILEGRGFACTVEPCWRGTPLANVLVVATRLATAPSSPSRTPTDPRSP